MQRLGRVLHMSPSRNIVVKVENTPTIGETVVDENLRPIGKILDVFGPVSSPYTTIKPTIREPEKLANKTLYVLPSKKRRRKNEWETTKKGTRILTQPYRHNTSNL